jgi:hypothetical protein
MTGATFAAIGAVVAAVFASDLWRGWRIRRRPHALAWVLALSLYAVGMVALVVGFAAGWTPVAYGAYWLTGALITVPLLAVGQLHLLAPGRSALWWLVAGLAVVWAVTATSLSSVAPAALHAATAQGGIPTGREALSGQPAYAALTPLTVTGTIIVVAGSVYSAIRSRRWTVLLIALGVSVAGSSSSFVRSGRDALVPVMLTLGVAMMYAGFRATASRGRPTPPAAAVERTRPHR